jgi:hypothetical protein
MPAGGGSAPQRHLSRSGARASLKESKEEEKRVDDALQLYMLVAYEAADITSDIVHCFFLAFWMRGCSQATKSTTTSFPSSQGCQDMVTRKW